MQKRLGLFRTRLHEFLEKVGVNYETREYTLKNCEDTVALWSKHLSSKTKSKANKKIIMFFDELFDNIGIYLTMKYGMIGNEMKSAEGSRLDGNYLDSLKGNIAEE